MEKAEMNHIRTAFRRIDWNLQSAEEVARNCLKIWKAFMPPTEENAEILSIVQNLITQYVPGITSENLTIPVVEKAINDYWRVK